MYDKDFSELVSLTALYMTNLLASAPCDYLCRTQGFSDRERVT